MPANVPVKLKSEVQIFAEKRKTASPGPNVSSISDDDLLSGSRPAKMRKEESSLTQTMQSVSLQDNDNALNRTNNIKLESDSISQHVVPKYPVQEVAITYLDKVWPENQQLVNAILVSEATMPSLQAVYEMCENVCHLGGAEELCGRLETVLIRFLQSVTSTLKEAADKEGDFLHVLSKVWLEFCEKLAVLRNIYIELDRCHIARSTKHASLIHLGKYLFGKHTMSNNAIRERTVSNILYLIQRQRDGFDVDKELMQRLLGILSEYSLYSSHFEPRLIAETSSYYGEEASRLLNHLSISDYLHHVAQRRSEEIVSRIEPYLHISSKQPVLESLMQQLVYTRLHNIISTAFSSLMVTSDKRSLTTLYQLVSSHSAEKAKLVIAFGDYIKKHGESLLNQCNNTQLVTALARFKGNMEEVLAVCFDNDTSLAGALKGGFEAFINTRPRRSAQLVAKYMDKKLRLALRSRDKAPIEAKLKTAMTFFRFLKAKDVFAAYYKEQLSLRLLLGRSGGNTLENNMVAMIEEECGAEFTNDLGSMLSDIKQSEELVTPFKESLETWQDRKLLNKGIEFQVDVLSKGHWPLFPPCEIKLPPELVRYQRAYEAFYTSRFDRRRLSWKSMMGSCKIEAYFPSGTKSLLVNVPQTVVLLLFNDTTTQYWTFQQLLEATHMDRHELQRVLSSLACGQHKVLQRLQTTKDIGASDTFYYNEQFQSPDSLIKAHIDLQERTADDDVRVESHVLLGRQHQLEAAIVRMLKHHRMMNHSTLLAGLASQLPFPVDPVEFKKRIEILIERDYIMREKNAYCYKE